ncbi:MAG: hypothetical protein HWE34_11965 [Methylocystaceae bacterium]|nr:hypothetical protein [Methylocystaceae bacterium]
MIFFRYTAIASVFGLTVLLNVPAMAIPGELPDGYQRSGGMVSHKTTNEIANGPFDFINYKGQRVTETFVNGKLHGEQVFYYRNSNTPKLIIKYKMGKRISVQQFKRDGTPK